MFTEMKKAIMMAFKNYAASIDGDDNFSHLEDQKKLFIVIVSVTQHYLSKQFVTLQYSSY